VIFFVAAPPWQERQLGYGPKLLAMFGFALLTMTALISGGTWIVTVPGMLINGPGPRDTMGEMLTVGLVLTGVLAISVFGVIKLYPYVSAPNRFTPSVVTLVPMLVFDVGLGLLPALLLAFLLGKKKRSRAVPYASISDLVVRGCRMTFSAPGDAPNKVALSVSLMDGERMYRELAQRFPAALGGWVA